MNNTKFGTCRVRTRRRAGAGIAASAALLAFSALLPGVARAEGITTLNDPGTVVVESDAGLSGGDNTAGPGGEGGQAQISTGDATGGNAGGFGNGSADWNLGASVSNDGGLNLSGQSGYFYEGGAGGLIGFTGLEDGDAPTTGSLTRVRTH
jgi:hypothetical protein